MANAKAEMFRQAGDLIELLERIDQRYFITAKDGKIMLSDDLDEYGPRGNQLTVWGDE